MFSEICSGYPSPQILVQKKKKNPWMFKQIDIGGWGYSSVVESLHGTLNYLGSNSGNAKKEEVDIKV